MYGQWKLRAQVQFYPEKILTQFPEVSLLESYQALFQNK